MRAVRFVKRLEWELPGTVFRHGLTIGDVDNDGDNELVVGTAEGDIFIFKVIGSFQVLICIIFAVMANLKIDKFINPRTTSRNRCLTQASDLCS